MGALLGPLGWGVLLGSLGAAALKALGAGAGVGWGLMGGGLVIGIVRAWRGVRRVVPIRPESAAWALDRVAQAGSRGLVAATVAGPAGAEAAWAPPRIDPPSVRCLPPQGVATALAGLLVGVLALAAPSRRSDTADAALEAVAPGAPAAGQVSAEAEARAEAATREAQAAAAVRETLGLSSQAAEDPAQVAERLAQPGLPEAARRAATEGSDVAAVLMNPEATPEELAAALAAGRVSEEAAREARRRAAAARSSDPLPPIPIERRALLERYFASLDGDLR
ncbi:MAG: hypothetical protein ACYTG6_17120 [Planctomycetota bacterium]|jgi:hypothetical protein